jgi:hypothetical protein
MEKQLAAKVTRRLLRIGAELDQTLMIIKTKGSPKDVRRFRPAIGKAMGELYAEIIEPILEEHPSLIPRDWEWFEPRGRGKE